MTTNTAKRPPAKRPAAKGGGSRWVFPAIVIGIVAVFLVVLGVTVFSGGDDDGGSGTAVNASTEVSDDVSVEGSSLPRYASGSKDSAVGMAAPELTSVDFQGDAVSAGGATGNPYALIFLAHYCPHCQAEVPRLVSVAQNGQIEGVDVIGIPTGTTSDAPNYPPSDWLADEDWPFPVLLDDDSGSAAQAYGLSAYPFMVFVDANGDVVGRYAGEMSEEDLTDVFAALAAGETLPLPGSGAATQN